MKVNDANQRRPHWADPLKAWGDVLVKQDKTKEALAKYNELSSSRRTGSNSKKRRSGGETRRLIWIPYCCRSSPAAWGRLRSHERSLLQPIAAPVDQIFPETSQSLRG